MKRIAMLALASLALADAPLLAQKGGKGDPSGRFGWLSSLEAGKAEAKKTGKPLMVLVRCVP
jgi:hypothetical protein